MKTAFVTGGAGFLEFARPCGELICSSAKAERELGYRPAPLSAMLEDCHRWMLEEGLLNA